MTGHGTETDRIFTVECRYNYPFLWRDIEFLHKFVHTLTAATFGDWLSPRAQAHYYKFQPITIGLSYDDCLITVMVEAKLQY